MIARGANSSTGVSEAWKEEPNTASVVSIVVPSIVNSIVPVPDALNDSCMSSLGWEKYLDETSRNEISSNRDYRYNDDDYYNYSNDNIRNHMVKQHADGHVHPISSITTNRDRDRDSDCDRDRDHDRDRTHSDGTLTVPCAWTEGLKEEGKLEAVPETNDNYSTFPLNTTSSRGGPVVGRASSHSGGGEHTHIGDAGTFGATDKHLDSCPNDNESQFNYNDLSWEDVFGLQSESAGGFGSPSPSNENEDKTPDRISPIPSNTLQYTLFQDLSAANKHEVTASVSPSSIYTGDTMTHTWTSPLDDTNPTASGSAALALRYAR